MEASAKLGVTPDTGTPAGLPPSASGRAAEVLAVLRARVAAGSRPRHRTDGYRLALVIEGGVARGAVSGGMALRLNELGLTGAFDDVYGSSAGAISAAWLASATPESLVGWADPTYVRMLIRRHGPLRRRPIVDVKSLVEVVYTRHSPMDFASIVTGPLRWHPIGTDAQTGEAVDLRPWVETPADVQLAIRASAAIPLLAGGPVRVGGRAYFDAGVAQPVPYRVAVTQGATHLVVLRSRQAADVPRLSPVASGIARTALRGYGHGFRTAFRTSSARYAADHARLSGHGAFPTGTPPMVVVAPPPGSATVGRMGRETELLAAAFEAGREAVTEALGPVGRVGRVGTVGTAGAGSGCPVGIISPADP